MKFLRALILILFCSNANAAELVEREPMAVNLTSVLDINGKEFSFGNLEDNVLVLHFWATWCPGCTQEMEKLNSLQKILKKERIIILPISEDFKGDAVIKEFYQSYGLTNLTAFIDKNQKLFHELGVISLPTTFIIDSSGQVVAHAKGQVDWLQDVNIALLKKYVNQKNQVNVDYANLLQSQKLFEKKPQPVQNTAEEDLIPKGAQTDLEISKASNFEIGEIRVTNTKGDTSSLKIRRPLNTGK